MPAMSNPFSTASWQSRSSPEYEDWAYWNRPFDTEDGICLNSLADDVDMNDGLSRKICGPGPCPCCNGPTVQRTNGRTGVQFYGCTRFSKCRGTRNGG